MNTLKTLNKSTFETETATATSLDAPITDDSSGNKVPNIPASKLDGWMTDLRYEQPGYFKEGYVIQYTCQPLSDDPVTVRKARTLYLDDGTEVMERIRNDFSDFFARCADPSLEIGEIDFGLDTPDSFTSLHAHQLSYRDFEDWSNLKRYLRSEILKLRRQFPTESIGMMVGLVNPLWEEHYVTPECPKTFQGWMAALRSVLLDSVNEPLSSGGRINPTEVALLESAPQNGYQFFLWLRENKGNLRDTFITHLTDDALYGFPLYTKLIRFMDWAAGKFYCDAGSVAIAERHLELLEKGRHPFLTLSNN